MFISVSTFGSDAPKALGSVAKVESLLAAVKGTGAKVILVNMWGVTCSPCKAEMPVLQRAADAFKDNSNVAFMGLCIPEDGAATPKILDSAAEIVRDRQVKYRNVVWSGTGDELLGKFNIQGTPYTVLLSADGKELGEVKIPLDPVKASEAIETSIKAALEKVNGK